MHTIPVESNPNPVMRASQVPHEPQPEESASLYRRYSLQFCFRMPLNTTSRIPDDRSRCLSMPGCKSPGSTNKFVLAPAIRCHQQRLLCRVSPVDARPAPTRFRCEEESPYNHRRSPHLDGEYTAFGKVIKGPEVIDKIRCRSVKDPADLSPRRCA